MAQMQINDVDVFSAYGLTLSDAPGWSDAPPRQHPVGTLAVRGVRTTGASLDMPRRLTLNGLIRGSSAADARSKLDRMKLALSAQPVKLSFSDHLDRYVNARLDSFAVPPEAMGSAIHKRLRCSIALTAHDPQFYEQTATSLPTGGLMPLGTGIHRPVITLAAATVSSPPFFVDLKDGVGTVVQTMTIDQGGGPQEIIIDCDNQVITADGVSILINLSGGSDFFRIDPLIHATFGASLWPEIVTRNIDSGGTPAITYRKAWR